MKRLNAGEPFVLNVYVEDLRDAPTGIFSAYVDVLYDDQLVSVAGDVEFGSEFPNDTRVKLDQPGVLSQLGAFAGLETTGDGELLLASVTLTADSPGALEFRTELAEPSPVHDLLLYGRDEPVAAKNVIHPTATVEVVSSVWQNPGDALDVNQDGLTTPNDALIVINQLNDGGARPLTDDDRPDRPLSTTMEILAPEGEAPVGQAAAYLDVNGDRLLTPMDALMIINRLNVQSEGESDLLVPQLPVVSGTDVELAGTSGTEDSTHSHDVCMAEPIDWTERVSPPTIDQPIGPWDPSALDQGQGLDDHFRS